MKKILEQKGEFEKFNPDCYNITELNKKISILEKQNSNLKKQLENQQKTNIANNELIATQKRFIWLGSMKINLWFIFNPVVVALPLIAFGDSDIIAFFFGVYILFWLSVGMFFCLNKVTKFLTKKIKQKI
jgi:hypothetical protein